MASLRTWIEAMVGTAVLAAAVALPASAAVAGTTASPRSVAASAASVRPDTATECNPNPLTVVDECTTVVGTGTYVDSISGQTFSNVITDLDNIHIEIYGPGGKIKRCNNFNLGAYGVSPSCLWVNPHPHVHVTTGNYCSRAINSSGSYLSSECVDVKN